MTFVTLFPTFSLLISQLTTQPISRPISQQPWIQFPNLIPYLLPNVHFSRIIWIKFNPNPIYVIMNLFKIFFLNFISQLFYFNLLSLLAVINAIQVN
jgi:hypothetical protein